MVFLGDVDVEDALGRPGRFEMMGLEFDFALDFLVAEIYLIVFKTQHFEFQEVLTLILLLILLLLIFICLLFDNGTS